MGSRSRILRFWALLGLLAAAIAVPLWGPLRVAWACYRMHAGGERAQAELVEKLESGTLLLSLVTGPQTGQACTAKASSAFFEAVEPGLALEVVTLENRPGECVLASTIERSGLVLWGISGGLLFLLLLLASFGVWVQRSYTTPRSPQRRISCDPGSVRCPACGGPMAEGYVPLLAGMHWRSAGEPIGLPHALGGLSGTVGWRGRPRLHAFRCTGCQVLTLQYGRPRPARG